MNWRKMLCLLLCLALVLSVGLPGAFALELGDELPGEDTSDTLLTTACEGCGQTEGHAQTCPWYSAPSEGPAAGSAPDAPELLGEPDAPEPLGAPVADAAVCTCENAPEKLSQHPDSCPRRQYVLGLLQREDGSYRTAEQIYAAWSSYDESTQRDVLDMVEVCVSTEYDALKRLIEAEKTGSTELPVDGVSVSGLPEGVSLAVRRVAPRAMSRKSLTLLGQHRLVFSLDITPQDNMGAWQPGAEETVTVSLDAAQFGLEDGAQIAILHEHDGDTAALGVYTVADGKLTFQTDGFSSFYGYTVDFEYDGTWYSIGGGGEVYLYVLFAMLGISRSDSEVSDVTVSDSSLLSAERVISDSYTGETAWRIRSLRAFDTAETMEISFYDGSSITVNVYDANYTSLTTGSYTFHDGDTFDAISVPEGAVVNITLAGTVTAKGTISIGKNAQVTITGSGTIQRGNNLDGHIFYVAGGKLTIQGTSGSNIIIDGSASFTVTDIPSSTRKRLEFQSGIQPRCAAIWLTSAGTLTLEYVTMQKLYSTSESAAIVTNGATGDALCSTVNLTNVTVQRCATTAGNSILLFNDCVATLTDCDILNNYSGGMYAGAIKAGGSNQFSLLTMQNCTASGNYSSGWGGVVLWAANNNCGELRSKTIIDGCRLTGNTARWLGGALSNEANMEVTNTIIQNNIAMAGGGIATFPFTLTESVETGGNACGLTLGEGNQILNNTAYANGNFTPYQTKDADGVDGDDVGPISSPTTYNGGGGGVWCYMNKKAWTCSLEIGKNNTISENCANNVGGGVYIDKAAGKTTTLSITGATISKNRAVNGGGIAVKDANVTVSSGQIQENKASGNGGGIYVTNSGIATVTGNGSVIRNEAANGGGLYIDNGELTVEGGIISRNVATGSYDGNTTKADDTAGVGGGAFIRSGTFSITGAHIGIYSNKAATAANDVYARGEATTVILPEVKQMDLTGVDKGEAPPTGWFADYQESDTEYPEAVIMKENSGRYEASTEGNVEVLHDTLESNQDAFYCLTLGISHPGYGTLVIKKSGIDTCDHDGQTEVQSSLFHVTGTTSKGIAVSLYVTVVGNGSVTIQHLMDGTYTVQEITDWTWRYEEKRQTYSPVGSSSTADAITINAETPDWNADFENEREKPYWLSGDNYNKNLWAGDDALSRALRRRKTR